jgi:alkylated DNA repair dioxygenase AlkB
MESDVTAVAVRSGATFERTWLDDGSWVDLARNWLDGADQLYTALTERSPWQQGRVFRYERWVDEPRLGASHSVRATGTTVPHPALLDAHRAIRDRYKVSFDGFSLAWYRDGRDMMAFHRDRDLRWLDDTVIALLVVGARRPFQIRPRANRYAHEAAEHGATHQFTPGQGDLLVMGGRTQLGWEHGVPRTDPTTPGRISVQWRWTSRTGRPVEGASYSAPRHYSR